MDLESKPRTPGLWIERLVIYERPEKGALIQDIPFRRGFNVIWGVAQDEFAEASEPGILSGHSVGKTSLCRLIRYCLGESGFGRKAAQEAIRDNFPQGRVGAVVHVGDSTWSVLRSIGADRNDSASKSDSLEELLTNESGRGFNDYLDDLRTTFLGQLSSRRPPGGDQDVTWSQLFSWLSRDQEARYQSLWQWRSSRSNHGVPSFARPKEDAIFLMRLLLGFLDVDEVQLNAKLDRERPALRECEETIARLRKAPQESLDFVERRIRSLVDEDVTTDEDGTLFGLDLTIDQQSSGLSESIGETQRRLQEVDAQIATANLWLLRHEQDVAKTSSESATAIESVTPQTGVLSEPLQKLIAVYEKTCVYGGIFFRDCPHYCDKLSDKRGETIARGGKPQSEHERNEALRRQRLADAAKEEMEKIEFYIGELRKQKAVLTEERVRLAREISQMASAFSAIQSLAAERQQLKDKIDGKVANEELARKLQEAEDLRVSIKESETRLAVVQGHHYKSVEELKAQYQELLQRVLSTPYTAKVTMNRGDLEFGIVEAEAGLAGEAVETLALVLADVASMLWTVSGQGYHPRFLLHDSPREADLHRHIYNRYLSQIHQLSEELGGEKAPFQYIVTTTSEPPRSVRDSDIVRLKLQSHPPSDLLFKRVLIRYPLLETSQSDATSVSEDS